jgi:uncharacterized protein (TIRG00374 family)
VGRVGWQRLNAVSAVGFMMLVTLPLRLGELARPILISKPEAKGAPRVSRSGALASCVVERVIDGVAVGVLGIVALRMLARTGTAADFARTASVVITTGFLGVVLALAFAFYAREQAVRLVTWLLRPISQRLAWNVAGMLDTFIRGLRLGHGRVLMALALTIVRWALDAFGFWLIARAFDIPLTPLMACAVMASNVVGVMIPAGPGMLGTSQFFTQLGVSMFFPEAMEESAFAAVAAAYANAIWFLQFAQQVGLGLVYFVGGHMSVADVLERQSEPEESPHRAAAQPASGASGS